MIEWKVLTSPVGRGVAWGPSCERVGGWQSLSGDPCKIAYVGAKAGRMGVSNDVGDVCRANCQSRQLPRPKIDEEGSQDGDHDDEDGPEGCLAFVATWLERNQNDFARDAIFSTSASFLLRVFSDRFNNS